MPVRAGDLRMLWRVLWRTVVRAHPRRAWFTLSLLGATMLRRPSAFADAVYFVLVHKGLYDYMEALGKHLDRVIAELATAEARGTAVAG